jgi:hypothetical protein
MKGTPRRRSRKELNRIHDESRIQRHLGTVRVNDVHGHGVGKNELDLSCYLRKVLPYLPTPDDHENWSSWRGIGEVSEPLGVSSEV